jgi:uncharacterized membrane protein YecN with MAPEG domain
MIAEGKRHRMTGIRYIELASVAYLPGLILALVVMGSMGVNALVAFGVGGLLLVGFFIYALASIFHEGRSAQRQSPTQR